MHRNDSTRHVLERPDTAIAFGIEPSLRRSGVGRIVAPTTSTEPPAIANNGIAPTNRPVGASNTERDQVIKYNAIFASQTVPDTMPPVLVSLTPVSESKFVSLSSDIALQFSEPVKAGTGNIVIRRSSDNSIFATIAVTDTAHVSVNTYTFINPADDFESGTGYYVMIDRGAFVDLAGNPFFGILSPMAYCFWTAPLVNFTTDTTLTSVVTPPAEYDYVTYAIGGGATLTLTSNVSTNFKIDLTALAGSGKLVSSATVTTTGAAISSTGVAVVNNGAITATVGSSSYAISSIPSLTNTGTITAIGGGGVDCWGGEFNNSGTITADRTAVYSFDGYPLTNSGTIHSNNGVGLWAGGSSYYTGTNSGLIYGQAYGLQLQTISFTNSGTITSPGLAVAFDEDYARFYNLASGTINGNVGPSSLFGYVTTGTVDNAGTINGNVAVNTFVARPGSIVNGNLVLGSGGTFATSVTNDGPGQFAGITGTVAAVNSGATSRLHYFVTKDASASSLNIPSMFNTLAFDFSNNAKLTWTPGTTRFKHIDFSGSGTVDVTIDLSNPDGYPMFNFMQPSLLISDGSIVPTVLDFTSRGTLSEVHNTSNWLPAMVLLNSTSKFTNAGTITLQEANGNASSPLAAIQGGGLVTNAGVINLFNANGIVGEDVAVVNTGIINRLAGDTTSCGIVNCYSVVNTGTISTGGQTVLLKISTAGSATLTNSGQITSANGVAVGWNTYALSGATIVNQAGGTITGGTYGVSLMGSGGVVTNAGTITGTTAAVNFESSATLILQTGSSLVGDVVGSQSYADALVLQGSGTFNNRIRNFTNLDVQGPGIWTFGSAATFATTTVSGGTLVLSSAVTSAFTVKAGATLQANTSTLLTQGTLNDSGLIVLDQAADGSFGAVLAGTGDLTKLGGGTLTLTGDSTIAGTTTIAQGTLALSGNGNLASSAIAANATFDISATLSGAKVRTLSGTGAIALGSKTLSIANGSTAFSGTISGTGGLVISGGSQSLTGTNTYSGGTVVKGGATLVLNNDHALGAAIGGLALGDASGSGTLQFAAAFDLGATRTISLGASGGIIDTNGFDTTLTALSGAGGLTKAGTGTLTLASGGLSVPLNRNEALHVAGGTLLVQGAFTGTGTVVVDNGAAFALDASSTNTANSVTIAPTSSGSAILKGGSAADVFTGGLGNDTFTGGLGNDTIEGRAGLDKAIYSGARSSYSITRITTDTVTVVGPDGTDTLKHIEQLVFSDQVMAIGTAALSDANGDGCSDIFWQNDNGSAAIWTMDGVNQLGGSPVGGNPGSDWHIKATGDFNGDGKSDILWQNDNGQADIWTMNGFTQLGGSYVGGNPGTSWHVKGVGDFNGDGKADILWQNDNSQAAIWMMDGLTQLGGAEVGINPGVDWRVKGVGDFNGDGKADILWQNDNGQAAIWLMDGYNVVSGSYVGGNPGPSWHVSGAADFDGDGKADILWQNDDGTPAIWTMDGLIQIGGSPVGGNPGRAWHVMSAGDYDGDGSADILWQNDNGQAAIWTMHGLTQLSGSLIGGNPGTTWHINS